MPPVSSLQHSPPLGFRVWRIRELGSMAAPHTHADLELNFVARGKLRYRHGGREEVLCEGEYGVLWGGVPHQMLEHTPDCGGIWLTIPIALFLQWDFPEGLPARLFSGELVHGHAASELFERWLEDHDSGARERRRALLLEVEALMCRLSMAKRIRSAPAKAVARSPVLRMERIAGYLARHYAEPLTLESIGKDAGMHPKALARAFRARCGLTLGEYLTRLRVAHAQRLLLATDRTVIDIALESGFGSAAAFYAAFARYGGGVTASEFRRAALGGKNGGRDVEP